MIHFVSDGICHYFLFLLSIHRFHRDGGIIGLCQFCVFWPLLGLETKVALSLVHPYDFSIG